MTAELFGTPLDDAWRRVGHRGQVVGIESWVRADGADAGARRLRIVNGDLDVELLPDRGLDLGQVRVGGIPLAWMSATGFPPLSVDGQGAGAWMRAFGGGMLTTCGLESFGAPSSDDGQPHPLHGRYSSLSAEVVRADASGDEIVVEGIVREASVFGSHLELRRRISSVVGSRSMRLHDTIVNRGAHVALPMVLYHLNLGWPLVDEGTVLHSPAVDVLPRDDAAARGLSSWDRFPAPGSAYPEQVFRHELPSDGRAIVDVEGGCGLTVRIAFDSARMPGLFQWRVAEEGGHYVLGVEPATAATILGRADARARGLLRPLAPGEALELGVEIEVMRRA